MGRYPYLNWWGEDSENFEALLAEVSYKLCLEELLHRPVCTLSGGERQRVAIGKAMIQKPKVLLLDEPTTYLDIGYQMQMMDLIRQWQAETNLTVIAVLHDLNLAAQYCDRILVLQAAQQVALGSPADVMNDDLIERVFGTKPIVLHHPVSALPQILLQPRAIQFTG
jgi:iron complex transport system ATP-binding protein